MASGLPVLQSRVLADTSSSGITSDAGAAEEEEPGVVDVQATRKEDVTNALTLRKMGSFMFPVYVAPRFDALTFWSVAGDTFV
jgi:hypothetical protein